MSARSYSRNNDSMVSVETVQSSAGDN